MPDWGDVRQDLVDALGLRRAQRALIVRKGIRLGLVTRQDVDRAWKERKK
jgi:hypothetical protein